MGVLTYDCRGHGASGKPTGPYTNALFVNDLSDLLDQLGWDKIHVAGASMGGSVALGFAATHPERTLGLGLIDTTAWYGAETPKNWSERAAKARAEGMQALVGFQQIRWFFDDFQAKHTAVLNQCIDIFLRCRRINQVEWRSQAGGREGRIVTHPLLTRARVNYTAAL